MSLGRTYRTVIGNACGQTIAAAAATVKARRWSYSSSGVQTWEATEASLQSNASLANAGYDVATTVNNSTTAYLGGTFEFVVTAPASSSGPVTLYLQRSTDAGTTWPDNGKGTVIAVLNFTAAGTQTTVVEF